MQMMTREEKALSDEIHVRPTTWGCDVIHDWSTIPPQDCPSASGHFHANCDRCMYKPDACKDCSKGGCQRLHDSERMWGPTPDIVREKMREHWATGHDPADLLDRLGVLF